MANRQPIVGSDNNAWGTILDSYLSVSLNSDGTINPSAITLAGGLTNTSTAGGALSGTYPNPTLAKATANSFSPANPGTVSSTTPVMLGLGTTCQYTPTSTGVILIVITGFGTTNTATVSFTVGCRRGAVSGGVPAFNAAATGTRFGAATDITLQAPSTATVDAFSFTAILSLTVNQAQWYDLAVSTSNAADTLQISNVRMSFVETA